MRIFLTFFIVLHYSLSPAQEPTDAPQVQITNEIIDATFYLPDTEKGYYRGTRFDWSAVMPSLEYKGHSYFGKWYEAYSPTLHDAIMGPVEAFAPIDYDIAKPGDSFLIIGIGMVQKEKPGDYKFTTYFPIQNPGTWQTEHENDRVRFVHTLEDDRYAYEYEKVVKLTPDKPQMIITHRLKNTGKKALVTNVYNHNFFVIDSQPTGPDFTVTFPFTLEGDEGGVKGIGKLTENRIEFQRIIQSGESFIYNPLRGHGDSSDDYDIRIENKDTGAGVRITCDQPMLKLLCWSAAKTICPEPYIDINVAPGGSTDWTITYDFYTLE